MLHIVEEDAEGFLRAFHGRQTEMEVALLILTVNRNDLGLFESLLEGVAEVDMALGAEIGLFLFFPGQADGLIGGEHNNRVLAGERLDARMRIGPRSRAINFYRRPELSPEAGWHNRRIETLVAQSSAAIVSQFCDALEIDDKELPCVATLIRGVPGAIVSRAGDRLSYKSVVRAARALRPLVQSIALDMRRVGASVPALRQGISKLERFEKIDSSLRKGIIRMAGVLESNHKVILRPQLQAMLAAQTLTMESFDLLGSGPINGIPVSA